MPKYTWIIFDADGTLFDYDRAEHAALTRTFRQYEVDFHPAIHEKFAEINGRLWGEFELGAISSHRLRVLRFEELADATGLDFCASDISADYLRNLGAQSELIPGAEDVVRRLARNFSLVLATNGIAEVQRSRFSASTIEDFFKALVISDEIGFAKPAPEFFVELFSRMGNPDKSEALMVGDALSADIKGGSDFGIDTCWFNPSRQANQTPIVPTYEIRTLLELAGITSES